MGAYSDRVIADGASYYWRLGEPSGTTAVDVVGGANGTISGGVTLGAAGAIGDGNTAMTFAATGRIVTAARTLTVPFTVEAWVKTVVTGEHSYFGMAVGNLFFGCAVQPSVVQVNVGFGDGTSSFVSAPSPMNNGLWHQVVWVLAGGTAIAVYVDGVARTPSVQLLKALPAITSPIYIPEVGLIFGQGWTGSLDEVAIYPRALTAPEIAAHYTLAVSAARSPLQFGYWKQQWHVA